MTRVLAGAAALVALGACGQRQEPAAAIPEPASVPAQTPAPTAARAHAEDPATAPGKAVFRVVGFRTPRSVLHDLEADVYLVSNVNGDPAAADDDDNGFISRVSPDGQVLDLKWIDGAGDDDLLLSAPMGMAITRGKLWVADRNKVHAFDARTGRHDATYKIPQATSLADVAVVEGAVIVSDNGSELAGGLFRLGAGRRPTPTPYLTPDQPGASHPQGLHAPGDGSLWVTAGRELYRVVDGKRTAGGALPSGALDGIVGLPGGELLVASHDGVIFRGRPRPARDGTLEVTWTELFADLQTPSDIGYDARRNRVLIPLVLANAIEIRDVPLP